MSELKVAIHAFDRSRVLAEGPAWGRINERAPDGAVQRLLRIRPRPAFSESLRAHPVRYHLDRLALLLQRRAGAGLRRDGGGGAFGGTSQGDDTRALVVPLGSGDDDGERAADVGDRR